MNVRVLAFSGVAVVAVCALCYFLADVPAALFFSSINDCDPVKEFFACITYLGESTVYLTVSAIAAIWFRYFRKNPAFSNMFLFVFVSVAGSGILSAVIKFVLGRRRPGLLVDHGLYGFDFFSAGYDFSSFPSGHANTVAALLLSIYLLFGRRGYLHVLAAIPVIASRVVIGAHFPSDVIFGSYLGIVTTLFLKRIFEKTGLWPKKAADPPKDHSTD